MQVTTTAPQTSSDLLAVVTDIAKVLAAVTLRKASLSSVKLCLDDNMDKAIQLEYPLRLHVSS
jgi:hypothetical protein